MSSLLGLAGLATLILLAVFCGSRPRLGAALSVALFGSLGTWLACQGFGAGTAYCGFYLFCMCCIARMSFLTAEPPTTNAAKE